MREHNIKPAAISLVRIFHRLNERPNRKTRLPRGDQGLAVDSLGLGISGIPIDHLAHRREALFVTALRKRALGLLEQHRVGGFLLLAARQGNTQTNEAHAVIPATNRTVVNLLSYGSAEDSEGFSNQSNPNLRRAQTI